VLAKETVLSLEELKSPQQGGFGAMQEIPSSWIFGRCLCGNGGGSGW
jgi:hypothetical protein